MNTLTETTEKMMTQKQSFPDGTWLGNISPMLMETVVLDAARYVAGDYDGAVYAGSSVSGLIILHDRRIAWLYDIIVSPTAESTDDISGFLTTRLDENEPRRHFDLETYGDLLSAFRDAVEEAL